MSDLLQAHERLAELLLGHIDDTVIDLSDRMVLKSSLVALSSSAAMGSSCIYLSEEVKAVFERLAEQLLWLSRTASSHRDKAVILLQDDRLYLHKYFKAERDIEVSLKAFVEQKSVSDEAFILKKISILKNINDAGKRVILNTLRQNLSVITGGPGTGKTTIVVRVLALLIEKYYLQGQSKLNIEILAPTGKAAARVKESIVKQKKEWLQDLCGFNKDVVDAIPEKSQTVQKFLGIHPTTRKSRFKRGQKANVDIVIVDEASMLDVILMKELLAAIRPTTRLILLGDPYQLASVEAGNVLAQIAASAALTEQAWLGQACIKLTESYRFPIDSGIGKLAEATNEGKVAEVLDILHDDAFGDVSIGFIDEALAQSIAGYQNYKSVVSSFNETCHHSVADVFTAFEKWQVFSPFRKGKLGVEGINLAIEEALSLGPVDTWYVGKPIIITANDHALKLYNGDIGICLDKEGKKVCFPATEPEKSGSQNYRFINTRNLPDHELVFAMTVHKSQGSEYERCMLVVPEPTDNQRSLLTREILYTAITRAKKAFMLFATQSEIKQMVLNKTERMSGLFKT
ncbi:exodeoxyribonuclease V subunit alpha [Rheinheimera sp. UJ63]|uniref:exodeoxyribonuclease V subunit alpha n=1 Tax=Rheinheimera sp. UJ63 TaxID=2910157 RepID=UPI001F23A2FC|nr:exodeoxyribonuclease V subunit alpha [Rheinheimera sp. UJ63]MCF4010658.1 exodeoxyribonuclease V subunit alpha [Rheinheimera sp. UJ63]